MSYLKNFMKNSTLILTVTILLASALLSSCSNVGCINGSGKQISEVRNVGPFTKIETSGSIKVVLRQDSLSSIRILADDNIQREIDTRVKGNTLVIDMEGNICDGGPVTIYISSKNYEGIEASGAVEIVSDGKLNVNDFDLDLSGSSRVSLDINAANLRTSSTGASEIKLAGQAGSHNLDLSGSSSVEALDFVVGKYHIESSGSSKSRINVLNELDIRSSGSSDIQYRGNPSNVTNDDSGASSVKKIN